MNKQLTIAEKLGCSESAPTIEEIMESNNNTIEMPLSKYTKMWLNHMEEEHAFRLAKLTLNSELQEVIQNVDRDAQAMKENLENEYRVKNLRPQGNGLEIMAYENQLQKYVEENILESIVYKVR